MVESLVSLHHYGWTPKYLTRIQDFKPSPEFVERIHNIHKKLQKSLVLQSIQTGLKSLKMDDKVYYKVPNTLHLSVPNRAEGFQASSPVKRKKVTPKLTT